MAEKSLQWKATSIMRIICVWRIKRVLCFVNMFQRAGYYFLTDTVSSQSDASGYENVSFAACCSAPFAFLLSLDKFHFWLSINISKIYTQCIFIYRVLTNGDHPLDELRENISKTFFIFFKLWNIRYLLFPWLNKHWNVWYSGTSNSVNL